MAIAAALSPFPISAPRCVGGMNAGGLSGDSCRLFFHIALYARYAVVIQIASCVAIFFHFLDWRKLPSLLILESVVVPIPRGFVAVYDKMDFARFRTAGRFPYLSHRRRNTRHLQFTDRSRRNLPGDNRSSLE